MDLTPPTKTAFDPSRYLTKVKGNDYLEAKWRIAWFRDVYPAGTITTELLRMEGTWAVVRAEVRATDADGTFHGSATGMAMDDAGSFGAFLEKCETAAVARALAMLGFGTQFAAELDDDGRIADAPMGRSGTREWSREHDNAPRDARQPTPFNRNQQQLPQGYGAQQNAAPSPKQMSFIRSVARELKMDDAALNKFTQELVNSDLDQISRRDASVVIEALKGRQQERENRRDYQR